MANMDHGYPVMVDKDLAKVEFTAKWGLSTARFDIALMYIGQYPTTRAKMTSSCISLVSRCSLCWGRGRTSGNSCCISAYSRNVIMMTSR